jgi:hypothetical protein
MSAQTLTDVAVSLDGILGNRLGAYGSVVTRVILRTAVDLRHPKPEQVNDAVTVSRVKAALTDMGYSV